MSSENFAVSLIPALCKILDDGLPCLFRISGLGTQSEPLPGAFDFSPNVPHGAMFLLDFAVIDDLLNRVLNTQAAHECRIDFLGDIGFILMFVSGFVVAAYIESLRVQLHASLLESLEPELPRVQT